MQNTTGMSSTVIHPLYLTSFCSPPHYVSVVSSLCPPHRVLSLFHTLSPIPPPPTPPSLPPFRPVRWICCTYFHFSSQDTTPFLLLPLDTLTPCISLWVSPTEEFVLPFFNDYNHHPLRRRRVRMLVQKPVPLLLTIVLVIFH